MSKQKVEAKANIAGLADLAKEYATGKMVEKKAIALRVRLIQLFKEGIATPEEFALMETILKRERNRGAISSRDNYMLNEIENGRCEARCVVKTDNPPQVHHLFKGLECKYKQDAETERFHVYVPRVIPVEHQMTREILMKEERGHFPAEEFYPKPKTVIHKLTLKPKEFDSWFEMIDEDILAVDSSAKEEVYTF